MGLLRVASQESKTITLGEEGDFIVVRSDISKRDFNALAARMPQGVADGNVSFSQASEFSGFLFGALVTGWSLSEGTPTVEEYEGLSAEGANAIDAALADHFSSLLPDSAEGK